jgi:hypothetical protein
MVAIGAAAAAALLIAVYASFWKIEVSRARAFAAAAAYEFNEGSYDRAAALALSGLPKAGSLFALFQPGDAEAELRRTGIHQIKDERLIPKGKDAGFTALKERFLARVADGAQVILTDVASGQERPRSIAAVCAKARSSESCAVNEIDTDEEGQRLLLTLDDGSIWLVNADDSAKMVVASKCAKVAAGAGRSESGSCMPSRIHLSAAGRYAVVNTRPQAFIAFDLDTGAERTLDLSRDCDAEKTQLSKSLCQEYQVRVLLFRGDDVLLARHGSRATLWMLSENGIVRDLPTPVDRAVKGPDKTLTGYSISGDTVAQIIPTAGQTPAQGTTIKLGNCDALIPPSQPPANTSGCRISSIAVSPKNSDLAVAITGGDILVRQPTGDTPSDPRILRVDCLPIKADAFALLDMDRPTRCSITDLRFAPDGTALAALGNDRMLRVFRVSGEQGRSGEGSLLASVALDAAVSFFGFDANSETLTVALGSGAIRRFELVAPPPRGLGALRSEICARLADHASPLTEFSAADIDEVGARFPDLKLSAADRSPCFP